jgi:hypothetical protein
MSRMVGGVVCGNIIVRSMPIAKAKPEIDLGVDSAGPQYSRA